MQIPAAILELVEFVNTGKTGTCLAGAEKTLGFEALRSVTIKFLSWLSYRSRRKLPGDVPLVLEDVPWCEELRTAMSLSPELSQVFVIQGNEVRFADSISPDERKAIELYVSEHYRPRLFT